MLFCMCCATSITIGNVAAAAALCLSGRVISERVQKVWRLMLARKPRWHRLSIAHS